MTRFKIQKLKFFVFLAIFFLSQISTSNANVREKHQDSKTVPSNEENVVKKVEEVSKTDGSKEHSAQKNKTNTSVIDVLKKTGINITSNETSKSPNTPGYPVRSKLLFKFAIKLVDSIEIKLTNCNGFILKFQYFTITYSGLTILLS